MSVYPSPQYRSFHHYNQYQQQQQQQQQNQYNPYYHPTTHNLSFTPTQCVKFQNDKFVICLQPKHFATTTLYHIQICTSMMELMNKEMNLSLKIRMFFGIFRYFLTNDVIHALSSANDYVQSITFFLLKMRKWFELQQSNGYNHEKNLDKFNGYYSEFSKKYLKYFDRMEIDDCCP